MGLMAKWLSGAGAAARAEIAEADVSRWRGKAGRADAVWNQARPRVVSELLQQAKDQKKEAKASMQVASNRLPDLSQRSTGLADQLRVLKMAPPRTGTTAQDDKEREAQLRRIAEQIRRQQEEQRRQQQQQRSAWRRSPGR